MRRDREKTPETTTVRISGSWLNRLLARSADLEKDGWQAVEPGVWERTETAKESRR
jgi:hypothetical protein